MGRFGLSSGVWGDPLNGQRTGPEAILKLLFMSGQRFLKRPCAILVRLVGRSTNSNETRESIHTPVVFVVRVTWLRPTFLWSQGVVHPGSHLLWWGLVYCLVPEVLFFREMPMVPKTFLEQPHVPGLQPYSHVKKAEQIPTRLVNRVTL